MDSRPSTTPSATRSATRYSPRSLTGWIRRSPSPVLVARLGGDEFVILLADTGSADDVVAVAQKALTSVLGQVASRWPRTYTVTASAGLVERPVATADAADLMRAADITLYWAKSRRQETGGRSSTPSAATGRSPRYALTRKCCRPALERGHFRLHYQPLISLADGIPRRRRGPGSAGNIPDSGNSGRTDSSPLPRKPGSSSPSVAGCWTGLHAEQVHRWGQRFTRAALHQREHRDPSNCADPELIDHVSQGPSAHRTCRRNNFSSSSPNAPSCGDERANHCTNLKALPPISESASPSTTSAPATRT